MGPIGVGAGIKNGNVAKTPWRTHKRMSQLMRHQDAQQRTQKTGRPQEPALGSCQIQRHGNKLTGPETSPDVLDEVISGARAHDQRRENSNEETAAREASNSRFGGWRQRP